MNDDYGILKYHFFLRFDSGKLNRPRAVFCSLVVELTLNHQRSRSLHLAYKADRTRLDLMEARVEHFKLAPGTVRRSRSLSRIQTTVAPHPDFRRSRLLLALTIRV